MPPQWKKREDVTPHHDTGEVLVAVETRSNAHAPTPDSMGVMLCGCIRAGTSQPHPTGNTACMTQTGTTLSCWKLLSSCEVALPGHRRYRYWASTSGSTTPPSTDSQGEAELKQAPVGVHSKPPLSEPVTGRVDRTRRAPAPVTTVAQQPTLHTHLKIYENQ